MSDDEQRRYDDREVATALRRAAQLQVEAAERAERYAVAPAGEPDGDSDGHDRQALVEAAGEAGIDEEFVTVALAELGETGAPALATLDDPTERAATRWLGTRRRSVSVSRVIPGGVDEIWAALTMVAESEAWGLKLTGSTGGHPARGGVALFSMIRLGEMVRRRRTYTKLCYRMEQLEAWSLRATLRDLGDRTDVTLYIDLREGVLANLKWARVATWLGTSAVAGGAFGLGLFAGLVAAGAFGIVGAIAGAGIVAGGWRAAYRRAVDNLTERLEALLTEVEQRVHRDALVGPVSGE